MLQVKVVGLSVVHILHQVSNSLYEESFRESDKFVFSFRVSLGLYSTNEEQKLIMVCAKTKFRFSLMC
jgi:hypothetical protein